MRSPRWPMSLPRTTIASRRRSARARPGSCSATIYEPPLVGKNTASRARVLLTVLNDHILRTAYRLGLDVLDLRAICTNPGDFTLQIQPLRHGRRQDRES